MAFKSDEQRKAAFSRMGLESRLDPKTASIDNHSRIRMSGFSALLALEGFDNVFSLNPEYKPPRCGGYTFVDADTGKIDENWKKKGDYVGEGGVGGRKDRYKIVSDMVDCGSCIVMPEVSLMPTGDISFIDGKHRFAVLRDKGLKSIRVAVPKDKAEEFKELYGIKFKGM